MSDLSDHKRRVAAVYNLAAEDYDKLAVRFFPLTAAQLVEYSHIEPGQTVLDVGTGTGTALIRAAQKVEDTGHVTGVDIAEDMLAKARENVAAAQLTNVDLQLADIEELPFEDNRFDVVIATSVIFFLPDMLAGLKEWNRVTKPGGWVAFCGYGESAFQPLSDIYRSRISTYNVQLPPQFSWQRLTDFTQYMSLLQEAGLEHIDVENAQLGYYLNSVDEWWDIIWGSGFRGPVAQLSPDQLDQFKTEHLAEIEDRMTEQGIWLDISALFARGQKPSV